MGLFSQFENYKRIIAGVFSSSPTPVEDGQPVALSLDNTGKLQLSSTTFTSLGFDPVDGTGQAIVVGATSAVSTVLTLDKPHWIWATESCWIAVGDDSVEATAITSFPLPKGAVAEFIPTTDKDYVAVIQMGSAGMLYIGQSR